MWNPSTKTNTSDNKQRREEEVVDDCRCIDEDAGGASGSSGGGTVEQQYKLNIFDNNSKATNTFGGDFRGSREGDDAYLGELKAKEFSSVVEAGDSGFISGPQTQSNIFEEEEEVRESQQSKQQIEKKYNIAPGGDHLVQGKGKGKAEENITLDSGCIDEDEYFDEDTELADETHEVTVAAKRIIAVAQTARSEPLKQQLEHESTSTIATPVTQQQQEQQMILKQNVDAGMSEWFCNLSLQADATTPRAYTQSEQQQHQQQVAGGINNLNAAGHKTAPITSSGNRAQTQALGSNAFSPTATTRGTGTALNITNIPNLTPCNAWEQFYQQNDDGDTPLHLACIFGYADVVAALIRMAPHPCLFNIQNDQAQTPLHLAALTAQPKILRMLLIAGAEPTMRDRHGNTALHLACTSGEEQCVRALTIPISASEIQEAHRQYGHRSNDKTVSYLSCARLPSDLEIRNYDGERCVHLAAQAGHIDILRSLVLYGADINAREGKSGRTPLHMAIECCNEDLANFLLDECQKLNLETATYAGLTAYQFACILDKSQMRNILAMRGAEPLTPPDSDYDDSDIETDREDTKNYDRFGDPGFFANYKGGNPMTVA